MPAPVYKYSFDLRNTQNEIYRIVQGTSVSTKKDEGKRQYNLSAIKSFISMEHPHREVS